MKASFFISFLFLSVAVQAQDRSVDVFLQANPMLSYNYYETSGSGVSNMRSTDLSPGFGVEVALPVSEKVQLVPFLKYSAITQRVSSANRIEQTGLIAQVNTQVTDKYMQWNQGVMAQYTLAADGEAKWQVLGGLGYALLSRTGHSGGGSMTLSSDRNLGSSFPLVEMNVTSARSDQEMSAGFFNIAAGTRFQFNVRRLGEFQVGTMFYLPLGHMPEMHFSSNTVLNGITYATETVTNNKKCNLEMTIGYKLFGLKLKNSRLPE